MTWQISPFGNDQFFSSNGVLAVGYKLYTYLAGTTTKEATAAAFDGLSFHTNPIVLNSLGMPPSPIYIDIDKSYKFVYATAADTDPPASPLYTADNITVRNLSSVLSEWVAGTTPTYISATQFSVTGDQRTTYHVGRRVKLVAAGSTVYGVISASVFGSVTTVTVLVDDGLTISASLSAVSYGLLSASGSSWPVGFNTGLKTTFTVIDDRTNTVNATLEINAQTTGTPAVGIGTGILLRAESLDEAPCEFGRLEVAAANVTGGLEETYFQVLLRVGGAVLSKAYRWAATSAFNAIFTHANTADRTYTYQNRAGTLAIEPTVVFLTAGTSWPVPTGVTFVTVEIFGASGGGGGGAETNGISGSAGGAGGTTSFNAGALTTTGGGAGFGGTAAVSTAGSTGAAHGVGSGGTVNRTGGGQSGGNGGEASTDAGATSACDGGNGGDGGYVRSVLAVTPGGSVSYAIGAAGTAGAGGAGFGAPDGGAGIAGQAGVIVLTY